MTRSLWAVIAAALVASLGVAGTVFLMIGDTAPTQVADTSQSSNLDGLPNTGDPTTQEPVPPSPDPTTVSPAPAQTPVAVRPQEQPPVSSSQPLAADPPPPAPLVPTPAAHICPSGRVTVDGKVETSPGTGNSLNMVNVTAAGTVTNRTTAEVIFSDDDPPDVLALDSQGNTIGMVSLGRFDYGRTDGAPKRGQFVLKPGQSMPFTVEGTTVLTGPLAKWYFDGTYGSMWGLWNDWADYPCTNPLLPAE